MVVAVFEDVCGGLFANDGTVLELPANDDLMMVVMWRS